MFPLSPISYLSSLALGTLKEKTLPKSLAIKVIIGNTWHQSFEKEKSKNLLLPAFCSQISSINAKEVSLSSFNLMCQR